MGDIDFDELDKAVNELATQGQPANPPTVSPKPAPAASAAAQRPTVQLQRGHARPQSLSPGVRRGGSMDILTSAKPVSRVGLNIAPLGSPPTTASQPVTQKNSQSMAPVTTSLNLQPQPEVVGPVSQPDDTLRDAVTPQAAQSSSPATHTQAAWPDPLEFHESQDSMPSAESSPLPTGPEPEPTKLSPFLADTKVEKRPLGAFAALAPQPPEPVTSIAQPQQDTDPGLIEPTESEKPVEATESTPEPAAPTSKESQLEAPESQLQHAATMAIPQQHRGTAPQPDTSESRPVFDTTDYHPPLLEEHAHHAGRSSKVGLVLALLSIATLLTVGGYLLFVYVTQGT